MEQGVVDENSEFFITGTSLGGALANLCAFYLRINGFKNIHFYANGAPRVGNREFREFMESGIFTEDSGNYVRYINTIKDLGFETEFDPVCKFPPRVSSSNPFNPFNFISDNPILKVVEWGFICSAEAIGYSSQPDYEMIPYINPTPTPPISADCSKHWDYIHSIGAYSPDIFNAQELNTGVIKYEWNYDSLRNINIYPCNDQQDESEPSIKDKIYEFISEMRPDDVPWYVSRSQVGDDIASSSSSSARPASSSSSSVASSSWFPYRGLEDLE